MLNANQWRKDFRKGLVVGKVNYCPLEEDWYSLI
jgi:hypothetical protein